jgi:hypothetical protein
VFFDPEKSRTAVYTAQAKTFLYNFSFFERGAQRDRAHASIASPRRRFVLPQSLVAHPRVRKSQEKSPARGEAFFLALDESRG